MDSQVRIFLLQLSVPNVYSKSVNSSQNTVEAFEANDRVKIAVTSETTDVGNYETDCSLDDSIRKKVEMTRNIDEYDYTDEEEFWEPASQETELKLQLDKILKLPIIQKEEME